jgi:predicted CXXCH cytochrome family protein
MRVASDSTVAGDFHDVRFAHDGAATTFMRRRDAFIARTEGPDGVVRDYTVRYTIGVAPLQQYLVDLPGGRLQALTVAWDTRPRAQGGQRWFTLHPGQRIARGDELHWTGIRQNWNYMCAECHSTGVAKNYDAATRAFATTFAAPNVGCEACHGAGSLHVMSKGRVALPTFTRANQVDRCARCHSRREQLTDQYRYDRPFGDTHRLTLLDAPYYYPDGQIHDEVFEYGSFAQSRMFAKGVVCSDCHDPHTTRLRATGNALCLRCHAADTYDTPKHHFHDAASPGAQCIACHMPTTTYMVVHARHDHSLRVPRPDLTVKLGVPNACSRCHTARTAQWAAARVQSWYGHTPRGLQQYAEALAASSYDSVGVQLLSAVVRAPEAPAIARATAISRLAGWIGALPPDVFEDVRAALRDRDPLLREAAVAALSDLDTSSRARLLSPMVSDSVRAVRLRAARALAGIVHVDLREYLTTEEFNADRPEAHLNLSLLYLDLEQPAQAERELDAALEIEPRFVPALVNIADVYRLMNRDADAERALRTALSIDPTNAATHHALGLYFIRQHRLDDALPELRQAARLAPTERRFAEVYDLAREAAASREAARR